MTTRELTFTSAGFRIAGTLTVPDGPGPHPAAVLITGSGPLDRDSNMKRQRLDIMNHVADGLAAAGIASLRYDKRGVGASEGDYHATGFADNVADAGAAVAALGDAVDASSLHVVGHSEGALIATRSAATLTNLDGTVLLSGSARSGKDVLLHQAAIASDTLPGFARLVLKLLRTDIHAMQGKRIRQLEATTTDSTRIQMVKVNAKWFREFMAYDPTADMGSITCPVLAITGEKDLQVPPGDVEIIRETVTGPVEVHRPADLTHLLRNDPAEPSLEDYKRQMAEPVDPSLVELVTNWITKVDTGAGHTA